MSLVIDLAPEVESRLEKEAARNGAKPAEYAGRLIERSLPAGQEVGHHTSLTEKQKAAIALLQSWIDEDATDDPEEIRIAEEEWAAFKRQMNENRAGEEPLYL